MHLFALAQTGAADAVWAQARAARELRAAIDALDDAGAALLRLAVDSQWRSSGVTALQQKIADADRRVGVEASGARDREAEVARIDVS